MTTIINILGGPGVGKSTIAAKVFSMLKEQGKEAEYVSEYVKGWAWEKRTPVNYDQFYFFAKQARREYPYFGKVDVIVSDAPVLLTSYYAQVYGTPQQAALFRSMYLTYADMCQKDGHSMKHYFLRRANPYNPEGRFQTEADANNIDVELRRFVRELGVMVIDINADPLAAASIVAGETT